MDFRNIFDKDPRSKEQLREELRQQRQQATALVGEVQKMEAASAVQAKVQCDLSGQLQHLKAEAATREKVLSDLFATADANRHENLRAFEVALAQSARRHAALQVANSLRQLLSQRLASNLLDSRQ